MGGVVGRRPLGYNGGEDRCQICEIRGHTQCRLLCSYHCSTLHCAQCREVKGGLKWEKVPVRRSTTESDPQFFHLMLFSDDNKAQKVLI